MIPASESDRVRCQLYQEFDKHNKGLHERDPIEYHRIARAYVERGWYKYLSNRKENRAD